MTVFSESPFEQIVGIHFPTGGFALLAIQASGSGTSFPSCNLSAGPLALGDIFDAVASKYVSAGVPYKHTTHSSGSQTFTIYQVEADFGGSWSPIHAWVAETDVSPTALAFPFSNWNWDGSTGDVFHNGSPGTLKDTSGAGVVAQIHHAFGDTTIPLRLGGSVYGPSTTPTSSDRWELNAIAVLNLTEIKKAIDLHPRDIEFITDFAGSWNAEIFTYKTQPILLPVGANNTPGPLYGALATDAKTESASVGETGGGSTVDFTINTATLKFI